MDLQICLVMDLHGISCQENLLEKVEMDHPLFQFVQESRIGGTLETNFCEQHHFLLL